MKILLSFLGLLLPLYLTACSTSSNPQNSAASYTSIAKNSNYLIMPPGLVNPNEINNSSATDVAASKLNPAQQNQQQVAFLQQDGNQRWIKTVLDFKIVYSSLLDYLSTRGLTVNYQSPSNGIIKTDWAAKVSALPQGLWQKLLGKVIASNSYLQDLYSFEIKIYEAEGFTWVLVSNYQIHLYAKGQDLHSRSANDNNPFSQYWAQTPYNNQADVDFLSQLTNYLNNLQIRSGLNLNEPVKVQFQQTAYLKANQLFFTARNKKDAFTKLGVALNQAGFHLLKVDQANSYYQISPMKVQQKGNRMVNTISLKPSWQVNLLFQTGKVYLVQFVALADHVEASELSQYQNLLLNRLS